MSDPSKTLMLRTRIWQEEPEVDNPFAAHAAFCHGYDVYGEMLGRASWVEMLYLLFRGEAPDRGAALTLETLAVALANPGPRDPSVHAAMCGGVGGSTAASCLMAALGVGAGQYTGAREVLLAMRLWNRCGTELAAWREAMSSDPDPKPSIWPVHEHPPGFDPHGVRTQTIVRQTLSCLAAHRPGRHLAWLAAHRESIEAIAGRPLALSGVAAATFVDLGFTDAQGEMLYLVLRLPGAAAHALEQSEKGYKQFPFGEIELVEPSTKAEQ
jgi:citrate synthase